MNLSVIFPAGKQAEAETYLAHLNAHNPDPGEVWGILRQDRHGQHVVPYLGPGGHAGGEWPEPDGAEALRADGVLAPAVDWAADELAEVIRNAGVALYEEPPCGAGDTGQILISRSYRGPKYVVVNGKRYDSPAGEWFTPAPEMLAEDWEGVA